MNTIFRRAVAEGGYAGPSAPPMPPSWVAFRALLARSRRGDVVAVMSHVERAEIFAWLAKEGYRPITLARLRTLVTR